MITTLHFYIGTAPCHVEAQSTVATVAVFLKRVKLSLKILRAHTVVWIKGTFLKLKFQYSEGIRLEVSGRGLKCSRRNQNSPSINRPVQ